MAKMITISPTGCNLRREFPLCSLVIRPVRAYCRTIISHVFQRDSKILRNAVRVVFEQREREQRAVILERGSGKRVRAHPGNDRVELTQLLLINSYK